MLRGYLNPPGFFTTPAASTAPGCPAAAGANPGCWSSRGSLVSWGAAPFVSAGRLDMLPRCNLPSRLHQVSVSGWQVGARQQTAGHLAVPWKAFHRALHDAQKPCAAGGPWQRGGVWREWRPTGALIGAGKPTVTGGNALGSTRTSRATDAEAGRTGSKCSAGSRQHE